MKWEQKPETNTWMSDSYTTNRVVVRKAHIGWYWLHQWKIGAREWDDGATHWSITRKCAERSARRFARPFIDPAPTPTDFPVSLNPEDLR